MNKKLPSLESESRKRTRNAKLEKAFLQTLAVSGMIAAALLAPGLLRVLKQIDPSWQEKFDPRRRTQQALYRLRKKGYVRFEERNRKNYLIITAEGKKVVSALSEDRLRIHKPDRWDKKWRIVIFDIPEKKRAMRDRIRHLLSRLGFLRLQDSVWVYPYDCEELVALIKTEHRVGGAVLYIIADSIEFDAPIKVHFDL